MWCSRRCDGTIITQDETFRSQNRKILDAIHITKNNLILNQEKRFGVGPIWHTVLLWKKEQNSIHLASLSAIDKGRIFWSWHCNCQNEADICFSQVFARHNNTVREKEIATRKAIFKKCVNPPGLMLFANSFAQTMASRICYLLILLRRQWQVG